MVYRDRPDARAVAGFSSAGRRVRMQACLGIGDVIKDLATNGRGLCNEELAFAGAARGSIA